MKFIETDIAGVVTIHIDKAEDERGYFARMFCEKEFADHHLSVKYVQNSISFNKKKGTLRGMHWQSEPFGENKIVSCIRGAIFDVAVDLRKDSFTFCKWTASMLSQEEHTMLYIPRGCAHGFQTLTDDAEVLYLTDQFYSPQHGCTVNFNDPALNIHWPLPVSVISEKDLHAPYAGFFIDRKPNAS
jgi:dTDP-4-dehydrorhamnose 3,5-epimerase